MKKTAVFMALILTFVFGAANAGAKVYTHSEGEVGVGQYGSVFVCCVQKDTGYKTWWAMGHDGEDTILDGEELLLSLATVSTYQSYRFKDCESGYFYVSNGLRTIIIPKDSGAAYIDGNENEFEYKLVNDTVFFSYKYMDMLFDLETDWNVEEKCLTLTERDSTPVSDAELAERKAEQYDYDETDADVILPFEKLSVKNDNGELNISVDGKTVTFEDAKPFIDENSRTQVPVRAVSEMLGCSVDWDASGGIVTITSGSNVIKMQVGSNVINVGGADIQTDTAAIIRGDRVYIPARYIAEALGLDVEWE